MTDSDRQSLCMTSRSKQSGVALITVLMVFAIATLIAGKVVVSKMIDTQRIAGMINRTQAYYYALAAEELAILALTADAREDADNNKLADDLEEPWAASAIPFEIDAISNVVVQIVDLNRFYNINNLLQAGGAINANELTRFRNLLVELDLDDELADNMADWLDEDNKEQGYLSESDAYAYMTPSYQAANRRFSDVSELRLVNGFDADVMARLLPHITALNQNNILQLNVNTATDYALSTLWHSPDTGDDTTIGIRRAQDVVSDRPFSDTSDFTTRASVPNPTGYSTESTYFEINVRANYAGHIAYLTTVVHQLGSGDNANYIVLSRKETDNSLRFAQFAN